MRIVAILKNNEHPEYGEVSIPLPIKTTEYHHENDCISVGLTSRLEPRDTKNITWVYLPTSNCQIERAMKRAGITDPGDLSLRMGDSLFPVEIDVALDFQCEDMGPMMMSLWDASLLPGIH